MGLDITAYSRLEKIDAVFSKDGEPIHPTTRKPIRGNICEPVINPDFPKQAEGIEADAVYRYAKTIGHHAGSYGGYNRWREQLAELAGWALISYERYGRMWPSHAASTYTATGGPFWELILFSDCEGTIGAATAAKLAKDFADHQAKADAHTDEHFRNKYTEWRAAFELAADGGCVRFH